MKKTLPIILRDVRKDFARLKGPSGVYLARSASCFFVRRNLSTRVCSEVEIETEVAL